ncbi:MAG: RluA family pseudouridine synthase [Clostridium sp.]|nr:RluA family pseudouridine synthase [Clostridium sp.]MCM1398797.1 RluA family pseudouridine synthase [Clostridium sp.]MCM1458571.1 RluA family pseudouridine synthase [Bacteroides sp.]
MRELRINDKAAGQRLNKYLLKYLDRAGSSFIYKMLRKKNITLNNKKAKGDEKLSDGDTVQLYLSEETIEKFKTSDAKETAGREKSSFSLKVLYEDEHILAVHKPQGMLSQKAKEDDYSINEAIVDYCISKGLVSDEDAFKPSVCNRLDRNTSGIILAGKSLHGSQMLASMLKERKLRKYYYTIVEGCFNQALTDNAYIRKDREYNKSYVIPAKQYKNDKAYSPIKTRFSPICTGKRFSLIRVELITGKSHQIRAHLAYLGYPVIGDYKYGSEDVNRYVRDNFKLKHQLLHAGQIVFPDGLEIRDVLPDIFMTVCGHDMSKVPAEEIYNI